MILYGVHCANRNVLDSYQILHGTKQGGLRVNSFNQNNALLNVPQSTFLVIS